MDTIKFEKVFNNYGTSGFFGDVELVFDVLNPNTNKDLDLALKVELFLDNSYQYQMAEIQGGVEPVFNCKYPCDTCSPFDKTDCETCPSGIGEPKYLQADRVSGIRTCKT